MANKKCFVLMPFAPEFDGIWEEVIRPTVTKLGDACTRADDVFSPGVIIDDVLRSIANADYLIADLTSRNPNVYYELGIAHAKVKSVILITQSLSDLPFDVRHRRVIEYADSAAGGAALRSALDKSIASL